MLKVLLVGIWACLATLGGVYLSAYLAQPASTADNQDAVVAATIVRGSAISLPVINGGAVEGYFLGKISLAVDSDKVKSVALPLDAVLTDELFSLLMGSKLIDLKRLDSFDPQALRTRIKEGMNGKLGGEVVRDVLVEQLDYMSKETVAINSARRGSNPIAPQKIMDGVTVEAPPAAAH
jgi:hypothetical protein